MMAITGARPTAPTGGAARSAGGALRSSTLAALGFATGLVVLSTIAVDLVTPGVPPEAAGVIYLVAVLGASTFSGLWWGLATSVGSALAFNFFFLPPAHTLVIRASSDWAALAVFVATAVVTSNLAARARHERDEAGRRAAEARLSESFATMIADAENLDSVLPSLAAETARALGAREGVIDRAAPAGGSREGVLPLELNGRWMGELRLIDGPPAVAQSAAAGRIARSLAGLIALGEERERRLRQQVQTEALDRSNELKTALLRAVSHDLRSPLMAITAAAGGLQYASLDEDERELLRTIAEQGDRMSRMIENLLDLSRLQAGAAAPHADWIDPRDLVEAAIDELTPDEQRARVALDLDHRLPLVRGDGAQLQRVVVNVIENALKFSPPDAPVEVAVGLAPERVTIAVADHGPGIPAADMPSVFEPFYRSSSRRDTPGSGLGLAIARGLAAANGCTLELEHTGDGGSTFVIAIPTAAESPA
jgi:two-component system sensor histidine kinase KdpD